MKYNISYKKVLNLFGLVLITIGALILTINTGKTLSVNTVLMEHIQKSYGLVSMGPMSDIEKENFLDVVSSAKRNNIIGYCLFSVGFSLQVVAALIDFRNKSL